MKKQAIKFSMAAVFILGGVAAYATGANADELNWSVVPYVGASILGDQSARISGADNIADGDLNIDVGSGFVAGIAARYDYKNSPWIAELGWEYRTNDSVSTASNSEIFTDGNYASNTFYLNGRYAFKRWQKLTPWLGSGVIWTQEIDLDSNNENGGNSFSDSGSLGLQLLAGVDYDISERVYLTSEIRYTSQNNLGLQDESANGQLSKIDYEPLTIGIGIGFRF